VKLPGKTKRHDTDFLKMKKEQFLAGGSIFISLSASA
jgi:hypothetical protein